MNRSLNVSWAEPQSDKNKNDDNSNKARTLLVNNIATTVQEDLLRSLFGAYGTINKCIIVKDQNTGEPKGFAYIEFKDKESCMAALNALNNYEFLGQNLSITISNQNNRSKQKTKNWNKKTIKTNLMTKNITDLIIIGKLDKETIIQCRERKESLTITISSEKNNNGKQNNRMQNNNFNNRGYPNQQSNPNAPIINNPMFNSQPGLIPQYMNPMMGNSDWRNIYMQGMNQSFQYPRNTNHQGTDKTSNNNSTTNNNNMNSGYPQYVQGYPAQPNYQYVYPYTDQNYNYGYYNYTPSTQNYTTTPNNY